MANWSKMKRIIVIDSLSGPNAIQTAKMDHSRISFEELHFENIAPKKTVFMDTDLFPSYLAGGN